MTSRFAPLAVPQLIVDRQERVERLLGKYAWVIEAAVAIERLDGLHFFGRQLEIEDCQIFAQPFGPRRFRYHRSAALDAPPQ